MNGRDEVERVADDMDAPLDDVIREAPPEVVAEISESFEALLKAVRDDTERRETEIGVLAMQIALLARTSTHMGSSTAWELEYLAGRLTQVILARGADRQ
jgi:hypothetical protein